MMTRVFNRQLVMPHGMAFFSAGVLLFTLLFSVPSAAATSITIAVTTAMDFGTIAIPASGSQSLTLSPSNSIETGSGTKLYGTPSRGVYTLKSKGAGGTSITIDISSVTTHSPYLTLGGFAGIYNSASIGSFPSAAVSIPTTAGTPLYLGATETVTSSMTPSSPNPTFDIVITVN